MIKDDIAQSAQYQTRAGGTPIGAWLGIPVQQRRPTADDAQLT
jgi:hypothetical protein